MFKVIKFIIWIVGLAVVCYAALRYFGYDINWNYLNYLKENKTSCEEQMKKCQEDFLAQGYENPNCQIKNCIQNTVDKSKIIIKRDK